MYRLTIDVTHEAVTLATGVTSRSLHGQWTGFYSCMALRYHPREATASFVEVSELRQIKPWFQKKPGSIGKEIARHLQDLSDWGLTDLIIHDGRTKRWRLGISPENVTFLPSRERCELWLRQQQWDQLGGIEKIPEVIVTWITCTTKALIRLERGDIEDGLHLIQEAKRNSADSVLLGAIAEVVELRLRARLGDYLEAEKWVYLGQCEGTIGKTLTLRASLAQALAPDFENLDAAIENLHKVTTRLQNLPDINGLGTAYNALGVLFRRNGQSDLAQKCLRYAIALLVASFDIPTLQAAVFNLGHTLYREAKDEPQLQEALRLIELDREVCSGLGIGRDSAQAEVVAGSICLELGDVSGAERWLREGREIAEKLKSDYNRAGIELLEARILWVQSWKVHGALHPKEKTAVLARYRRALNLTSQAGFPSVELEQELARVQRGGEPQWPR